MVYFVGMTNETMFVRTADGVEHCFLVWVARTYADLGRGLAGLRGLDADRGMVLDFGSTILASVTMRGMLFPLDIVFLNSGGFVMFSTTAEPNDRFLRQSMARWVVELPAGTVERLGIDSSAHFRLALRPSGGF